MLRINLLHDAQPSVVAEEPSRPALAWLAGALAIALCACLAGAGYAIQKDQLLQLQASAANAPTAPAAPAVPERVEFDNTEQRAVLEAIARSGLTAQQRASQQKHASSAIAVVTDSLKLEDERGRDWQVNQLSFDGEVFAIEGRALRAENLERLMQELQANPSLKDVRFTSLRVDADLAEQRRGVTRNRVNAPVAFKLYAAIPAVTDGE